MTFEEAERQYQELLRQWQAGQIDPAGFHHSLEKLQVQAQDGTFWRLSSQDGRWLRWDGSNWIPAHPSQRERPEVGGMSAAGGAYTSTGAASVSAPPETKKGRRWWIACLVVVLLSCGCLALAAGGGYFAVQAGSMSALQLSTTLRGVADVSIANLDDYPLSAELNQLDLPDEEAEFDRMQLEPFDIGSFASLQPGRYDIDFESVNNPRVVLSCTIVVRKGDVYQFVAVPEGIAVSREGYSSQESEELDVSTSSLCRQ